MALPSVLFLIVIQNNQEQLLSFFTFEVETLVVMYLFETFVQEKLLESGKGVTQNRSWILPFSYQSLKVNKVILVLACQNINEF